MELNRRERDVVRLLTTTAHDIMENVTAKNPGWSVKGPYWDHSEFMDQGVARVHLDHPDIGDINIKLEGYADGPCSSDGETDED